MKTRIMLLALMLAGMAATAADIQLPKPQTVGGAPLMTALANRQTIRSMTGQELTSQQLSDLLWAANGINRPDGRRTVPTARNKQEISLYVLLPQGAYRYEETKHQLVQVAEEKLKLENNAAVVIVMVVDRTKQSIETLAAVDCGFIGQNIYLYCAGNSLATVFKASFNAKELTKLLKLEPKLVPMYVQPVGHPK